MFLAGRQLRALLLTMATVLPRFACADAPATTSASSLPAVSAAVSLDGQWQLAVDPSNVGRDKQWFSAPTTDAKRTKVPWIIQDAFPGYHGVAWYWRDFDAPNNPHVGGRMLLRFEAVDYLGEVWLNGQRVGGHEGGETPFEIDVTDAIKSGAVNHLAVRVLNPTHAPIDGFVLNQTPKQARVIPYSAGSAYNHGGITGSVSLLIVPAVRVEDLYAAPDAKSHIVHVRMNLRNGGDKPVEGTVQVAIGAASEGQTLAIVQRQVSLAPRDTSVDVDVKLPDVHLWDVNDPYLYRVTASVRTTGADQHEQSVRCGFRDFRFENGYFRLNGRRIFLRSTHTCNHFPVGLKLPPDPDMARRDLIDLKAMGFNMVRFIWGGAERYQLDLCDEIGLMVYEESFASWPMDPSPKLGERFDRSVSELMRRDRNHPSIAIWGLLNESQDNAAFAHATTMLPLVRDLDPARVVLLNAGRFDNRFPGGSGDVFSQAEIWHNPASREPWVTHNPAATPLDSHLNFVWGPRQVALHPGIGGEYSVVRWAAPRAGECQLSAIFTGLSEAQPATTDVHVLHNGKPLFDSLLNLKGKPNIAQHQAKLNVDEGDTIDFVVGFGNASYGSDSTGLAAMLQLGGKTYDVSADYNKSHNPQLPWAFGMCQPAEKPDASTFVPYTVNSQQQGFGSISNPGSDHWEDLLTDMHNYPRVPHTAAILSGLRTMQTGKPLFLSEYGIGSAVDLWRVTRQFERIGKTDVEDAQFYRQRLDQYLADWKQWKLDELYARPEDFFAESLRKMAGQRSLGLNAIRANPHIVGYSLTGMNDHVSCGEGLTTTFRELKPGTVDAMFEGFAPLKWCLSVEPRNLYTGSSVHVEAVLSNEDALPPGEYPVRLQVVGPDNRAALDRVVMLKIGDAMEKNSSHAVEPPFALPVFSGDVKIEEPSGKYRLLATMQQGGAPTGGETEFYAAAASDMPALTAEVVMWGTDPLLVSWLAAQNVKTHVFDADAVGRQVILAGAAAPAGDAAAWSALARRIARGDSVVFLSPQIFQRAGQPTRWLPLAKKGALPAMQGWLYLKDEWAKRHPIFDGLPAGGLMDYTFYREIIPDAVWAGQDPPAQAVAGAIKASQDYSSGLMVSVNNLGAGRFTLNSLLIRENLGQHPAAERLLRNMLNDAARDAGKALEPLPADFDGQLKSFGY